VRKDRRNYVFSACRREGSRETSPQYSKCGYKEDGGCLFIKSHMEMTRGSRYKLYLEKFHPDIRKKFFTVRTTIHWNNLPRDTVKSPSLEVFKM